MPIGKLVFAQLMDFLPLHTFRRCVARYPSNYPTKTFSHLSATSGSPAKLVGKKHWAWGFGLHRNHS